MLNDESQARGMSPVVGYEAQLHGARRELRSSAEVKLLQDVLQVVGGGLLTEYERPCNLAVGQTTRRVQRDLTLARS
jgi:hypothetical protein